MNRKSCLTWLGSILVLLGCGPHRMERDDAGPEADAGGRACSATDVDACEYPSRGLAYVDTRERPYSVDDPLTGRSLPLRAYIPEGEGPFPVVLYSHGGSLNDVGHNYGQDWGHAFAAHGYVSIHVAHSEIADPAVGEALCELASVPPSECTSDLDGEAMMVVVRGRDMIAVMDALPALSQWSEENGGPALDLDRIAVAGWSGGSRTTMTLFGAETVLSPSVPRFTTPPDARLRAAIVLSPTGPGFGAFFDEGGETSWDSMRGPTLMMTGENDVKPDKPDLTGPIRRFPFTAQPGDGTRRLLYSNLPVGVGGHPTYNLEDLDSTDERVARLSRAVRSAALAFLDAHLNDDAAARAWLDSDAAAILAGDVDWELR